MKRLKSKKGFTMAELLIVVAIIAVLVAISVPIFANQLEKSREATDAANIRDYYSEIAVALVDGTLDIKNDQTLNLSGGKTAKVSDVSASGFKVTVSSVSSKQTQENWQTGDQEIGGVKIDKGVNMVAQNNVIFNFTIDGTKHNTYLSSITFATTP